MSDIITCAFPTEGSTQTLPSPGINTFDFASKNITYADGTTARMNTGLSSTDITEHFKSLYLYSDQAISIKLKWVDDNGHMVEDDWITIQAKNTINRNFVQFRQLQLKTTVANTNISFTVSTVEWARIQVTPLAVDSTNVVSTISTTPASEFTTSLATNASDTEDISGLSDTNVEISNLMFRSRQNLNYDLFLFASSTYEYDDYIGKIELDLPSYGETYVDPVSAVTWYIMDLQGLGIQYYASDSELHLALINRSATTKVAGANGYVSMTFKYVPRS